MQLVDEKARKGKIEDIEAPADEQKRASADIYDLTELLKRSLSGGKGQAAGADGEASAKPGKASRKKSTKSANR
jgi:DNA end-binding protein Ku